MKRCLAELYCGILAIIAIASLASCKHPLLIEGEGDIVDLNGSGYGCTLQEYNAYSSGCLENDVKGDYFVNYKAVPKPGWVFTGWRGPCSGESIPPNCRFDIPAHVVPLWEEGYKDEPLSLTAMFEVPSIQDYREGRWTSNSETVRYSFDIATEGHYQIALSSNSVDTVLYLYREDGTYVAEDDDSGFEYGWDSFIQGTLQPGGYTVVAASYPHQSSRQGAFTIGLSGANFTEDADENAPRGLVVFEKNGQNTGFLISGKGKEGAVVNLRRVNGRASVASLIYRDVNGRVAVITTDAQGRVLKVQGDGYIFHYRNYTDSTVTVIKVALDTPGQRRVVYKNVPISSSSTPFVSANGLVMGEIEGMRRLYSPTDNLSVTTNSSAGLLEDIKLAADIVDAGLCLSTAGGNVLGPFFCAKLFYGKAKDLVIRFLEKTNGKSYADRITTLTDVSGCLDAIVGNDVSAAVECATGALSLVESIFDRGDSFATVPPYELKAQLESISSPVDRPPANIASFSITPSSGTSPLWVQMNAKVLEFRGQSLEYKYRVAGPYSGSGFVTISDGGSEWAQHEFRTPGTYTVELLVRTHGHQASRYLGKSQQTVVVSEVANPAPSFSATPQSGPAPLYVQFSAANPSGNIVNFSWDVSDGRSGPGQNVAATFESAGQYTVTLTVEYQDGTSDQASQTVTVSNGSIDNQGIEGCWEKPQIDAYCFYRDGTGEYIQYSVNGNPGTTYISFNYEVDYSTDNVRVKQTYIRLVGSCCDKEESLIRDWRSAPFSIQGEILNLGGNYTYTTSRLGY